MASHCQGQRSVTRGQLAKLCQARHLGPALGVGLGDSQQARIGPLWFRCHRRSFVVWSVRDSAVSGLPPSSKVGRGSWSTEACAQIRPLGGNYHWPGTLHLCSTRLSASGGKAPPPQAASDLGRSQGFSERPMRRRFENRQAGTSPPAHLHLPCALAQRSPIDRHIVCPCARPNERPSEANS